jgi:hypothetical protein
MRRRRPEDAPQPWDPPPADEYDIRAVKALAAGVASDGQQRRALDWIIRCAAGTYDLSFRPGVDGHRATTSRKASGSSGSPWCGSST